MKNSIKLFLLVLACGASELAHAMVKRSKKGVEKHSPCVDYIVVGCGTAGSVVARMLSDDDTTSVILLERGSNYLNNPDVLQCGATSNFDHILTHPKFSDAFIGQDAKVGAHTIVNGVMTGGSGAHNFGTYVWADTLLDQWAAITGDNRWLKANVEPFFKANETYIPNGTIPSPLRGTSGPLLVSQAPPLSTVSPVLAQNVASAIDAPLVADYNVVNTGTSTAQLMCDPTFAIRSFSARAYLNDVLNPDGTSKGNRKLTLLTQARATKILFGGKDCKTAKGIRYIQTGKVERDQQVFARKGVILSLGSIYTPQLLMLSGVGPKAQLNALGIPIIKENEHVGAHFKYHYGPEGIFLGAIAPIPIIGFGNNSVPQGINRNTEYVLASPVTQTFEGFNQCVLSFIPPGVEATQFLAWNLAPGSEGTVQLSDNNPLTEPSVDFNSFSDGGLDNPNSDASKAVRTLKRMRTIAISSGGQVAFPTEADYAAGDEALLEATFVSPSFTNHYMATCRMAKTDQGPDGGVVTGGLKVIGLEKLYIADVSVVPSGALPTGNTSTIASIIGIVLAKELTNGTAPIP